MLSELFHPMTFKHKLASELKACLWYVFEMIQKHSRASQEYFMSLFDDKTPLWFLHLFFLIENINLSKVTSFTEYKMLDYDGFFFRTKEPSTIPMPYLK